MIRMFVEGVGWFIFVCALANLAGLIEFRLHLNAPKLNDCVQENSVHQKPADHPLITQLKRDARKLTKAHPDQYTHMQAMELLARQQGYSTYASMRAALKTEGHA